MFETYVPEKFCREFVALRGHSSQLAVVMAVVEGLKPCMDDWIPVKHYDAYKKICRRYGLIVKPDAVFEITKKNSIPDNIIGKERLTTTNAYGRPFGGHNNNGNIHVFVAKTRKGAEAAFENGWYPLIIKERVIDKPLIDSFKFGHDLGYPTCCVDFFRKFNNWNKYSFLFEILRNSQKNFHYLANPFTRDVTYSYIYHMPCSYHCRQTISFAVKLRNAIKKKEPGFVTRTDRHLKMPVLVFYERKFYAFEGQIKNNKLFYKKAYFIGQMPENNLYERDLARGDCVLMEDKDVIILKNRRIVKRIEWKHTSFAPETPFLIQFH